MKPSKSRGQQTESERARKVLLGVGLLGFGLLTAAVVGLVVVSRRNLLEEPDQDDLLGIGA